MRDIHLEGAMTNPTDNYEAALEKTPECARRIGIIMGLFAMVEIHLVGMFRWIANMDPDPARIAMESHKHFSNKIVYLLAVCDAKQPHWERDVEAGKHFAAGLKLANTIRNKYAHSKYGWTGEPGTEILFLSVFADSIGGHQREEIADIQILDTDILFLKSLIAAMRHYCADREAGRPPDLSEIQQAISMAQPKHLRPPRRSASASRAAKQA